MRKLLWFCAKLHNCMLWYAFLNAGVWGSAGGQPLVNWVIVSISNHHSIKINVANEGNGHFCCMPLHFFVCHFEISVCSEGKEMLLLSNKCWPWLLFQHLWCLLFVPAVVHKLSARPDTPLSAVETAALILLRLNSEGEERTCLSTRQQCTAKAKNASVTC